MWEANQPLIWALLAFSQGTLLIIIGALASRFWWRSEKSSVAESNTARELDLLREKLEKLELGLRLSREEDVTPLPDLSNERSKELIAQTESLRTNTGRIISSILQSAEDVERNPSLPIEIWGVIGQLILKGDALSRRLLIAAIILGHHRGSENTASSAALELGDMLFRWLEEHEHEIEPDQKRQLLAFFEGFAEASLVNKGLEIRIPKIGERVNYSWMENGSSEDTIQQIRNWYVKVGDEKNLALVNSPAKT